MRVRRISYAENGFDLETKLDMQSERVKFLLGLQMVLILGVGVAYLTTLGRFGALSSVYGGCIAMFSTWMLGRYIRLATEAARDMPGHEVGVLYKGAIQRFLLVLTLFMIGMALLKLSPVPLLVGFTVSQGAFILGAQRLDDRYIHGHG